MTKNGLIEKLAEKANIPRVKALTIVDTIFNTMTEALMRDDRIEIRGFGTFSNRQYEARKGRNPSTGRAIRVHPKKLPHYKMAKELKNELVESYKD
jgi:integration host factor subunit beta